MKHKHADVIKAWADGEVIESNYGDSTWVELPLASKCREAPCFFVDVKYRIRPASPRDEQTDDHTGICMEVEA